MYITANKKASTFIYVLLLINIAIIIGIVVYNNSIILSNNIDVGKNTEEIFLSIYDKGNINIESVKKYNSDGNGYIDGISCPTNITMSGSTSSGTSIVSQMTYSTGSIYCGGIYNIDDFRIYFNYELDDFEKAYYKGDMVNLVKSSSTSIYLDFTNISSTATISSSTSEVGYESSNTVDSNINTYFLSANRSNSEFIEYNFPSTKSIGWITIKKPSHSNGQYWDRATIYLYDISGNVLDTVTLKGVKLESLIDIDLKYRGLTADVKSVRLEASKYLDISEFEIYELKSTGIEEVWEAERVFNDSDSTFLSFTSEGIGGGDNIDDDFNSDDYTVGSTRDLFGNIVYYTNNYQDNDSIPRKVIFGNIKSGEENYNIFWNNYKTNAYIDTNINNDDSLSEKISNVTDGNMYIDIFTESQVLYDMKVLKLDRVNYKDYFTLLPLETSNGYNLTDTVGYIQDNSGVLSLSKIKTGSEYIFDFANSDYAIFLTNKTSGDLSYRLSAETGAGTGIYINPIDDSGTGTIETLSNHIIIGGEKNFIGDNVIIVGDK